MRQFLAILAELLPQIAPTQTKYRVTQLPSERTIRFYTANMLVDKPAAKDGAHALYGYRQLLQVIAIKYLQSQYLPLVKVRSLVENASNRDLELLIPEISPVTAAHRSITREDRAIVDKSFLPQVIDFGFQQQADVIAPVENQEGDAAAGHLWRRIEVSPGIELHVHASALTEEAVEQLRGALLQKLGVLRGWFSEGKE